MRRILLAILLLVGAMVPGAAAALEESTSPSISIVGKRTSFIDVRFDKSFSLDEGSTKITTRGEFAGWLIHPLGRPASYGDGDIGGAYMLRDVAPTDPQYGPHLFTMYIGEQTFPAGRYRIYLLADGPAEIRIPMLQGATSKRLRPIRATGARWTAKDIPLVAPGVVKDSVSQPIRVGRRSLTFNSLYLYSEEGATIQDTQSCLRDRTEEAAPPEQNCEGGGWLGSVLHARQDYEFTLTYTYPPGSVAAGKYYAFAKARATAVNRVMGVGVSIDLRGV